MAVIVALDAGTTGVRAFAVDDAGQPAGYRYREFTQHYPRPGWVEHDPLEIWDAVVATTTDLIASLDQPVAALGITNQRETVVVWDRRTGEPLHRAVVWQDRRTAQRCEALEAAGYLPLVRDRTGLVLDPYFSASKLAWLLTEGGVDAGPQLAFGTVDAWLVWKLTGGAVHATEASNASRTMLFDIRRLEWSDELCDLFSVPASCLPEVRPSSGRLGVTHETSGLPAGIPISGVAGDQQAALFGQACFEPGMTKNTYGTGSFVLMNVGDHCPDPVEGLLTTVAWTVPASPGLRGRADRRGRGLSGPLAEGEQERTSTASLPFSAPTGDENSRDGRLPAQPLGDGGLRTDYAFEGAIFSTGSAIQWLRDGLGIIAEAAEVGPLAEACADTEGVYLVPAFTGLGSPWWDPYARATVLGITRGTGRSHLARAAVEAMAYQTRDVVEAMSAHSGHAVTGLRADGGASVMDLLLQLQADQLQAPVARPRIQETTALGAAYLAGLAEGVWSSLGEISANWVLDVEVTPSRPAATADAAHAQWRRAVERSRDWARER